MIVAYGLRDFELAASVFSEDCIYTIHVPTEITPYGGTIIGRKAILDRLKGIGREFEVLSYEARQIVTSGDCVRSQICYEYRHRASGEVIDGVGRLEATFADGKIVKWSAFHDVDRIQAFLRLCQSKTPTPDRSAATTIERVAR